MSWSDAAQSWQGIEGYWQLCVIAAIAVAFGVFYVKHTLNGRTISARIQKQGGSPLLGTLPMEFAYWILKPIGDLASRLRLSPNLFSWSCLVLGFAAGVVAGMGYISAAGALSMISGLLDALDGMVARKRGVASDAGEVLDATVDRYAEFFLLAGLAVHFRFNIPLMVLTLAALLGSFMVSYTQAKAEAMQIEIPKGWMRRPERAAYLGAGTFLGPLLGSYFDITGDTRIHVLVVAAIAVVALFSNAAAVKRAHIMYSTIRRREAGRR